MLLSAIFLVFLCYLSSVSSFCHQKSSVLPVLRSRRPTTRTFATTEGVPETIENKNNVPEEKSWMTQLGNFAEERNVSKPILYGSIAITSIFLFYELSKFLVIWSIPMLFAAALLKIAIDKVDETSKSVSNTVTMGFMKANSVTANSESIAMVFPYVFFTVLTIGSLITAEELHLSLPFDISSIDVPHIELPFSSPSINLPAIHLPSLPFQLPTLPSVSLPSPPSLDLPTTITVPIVDLQYCVTVDGDSCQ